MVNFFESFRFTTTRQMGKEEARPEIDHIWDSIFSHYSYAALSPDAKNELDAYLKSFYDGCGLVKLPETATIPSDTSSYDRNTVIYFNDELYYADKEDNTIEKIKITDANQDDFDDLKSKITEKYQLATGSDLKLIRSATECTRLKTPVVLAIFERRSSRKEALLNCDALLDETIPEKIHLLNKAQVIALDKELRFALTQYLAQSQAASDHIGVVKSQHTELAQCYRQIKRCTRLRKQLELRQVELEIARLDADSEHVDLTNKHIALSQALDIIEPAVDAVKPASLFSILPGFLKEDEDDLDSDYIITQLSKANGRRLYWVWTRCLIESFIITAHQALLTTTIIAAWVSFTLYWLRGGVTTAAAVQHSFDLLVSERERVIAAHKRRRAHLQERLHDILNDIVWGCINFACYYVLCGPGYLGYIGDVLTVALLGMDFTLAACRFDTGLAENEAQLESYNAEMIALLRQMDLEQGQIQDPSLLNLVAEMRELITDIGALEHQNSYQGLRDLINRKLHQLILGNSNSKDLIESKKAALIRCLQAIDNRLISMKVSGESQDVIDELDVLMKQFLRPYQAKEAYNNRWDDKYTSLFYDTCYGALLCVAFAMVCYFCLGPFVAMPIAISLLGVIVLNLATLVWRTANARLDISRTNQIGIVNEEAYNKLIVKFVQFADDYKTKSEQRNQLLNDEQQLTKLNYEMTYIDGQMKQLYLDMLQVGAQSGYQSELVQFKAMELARATFLRLCVPVAIALTLLLAPALTLTLPTYLFLMAGVLVFAVATSVALNKLYKPQASKWRKADESTTSSPHLNAIEYQAFRRSALTLKTPNSVKNPLNEQDETASMLSTEVIHFDLSASKENGKQLLNEMKKTEHRVGKKADVFTIFSGKKFEPKEAQDYDHQLGYGSVAGG
ncbi:MAG: hypothetical protein Q8R83_08030 [Legionellaceae bacterium]|nr:hypothetical protein [Legionellaceae bacterium]